MQATPASGLVWHVTLTPHICGSRLTTTRPSWHYTGSAAQGIALASPLKAEDPSCLHSSLHGLWQRQACHPHRVSAPACLLSQAPRHLGVTCGDWLTSDIFARWPPPVALELASFQWPLTQVSEVTRLLSLRFTRVRDVVVGEFSGCVRTENERVHQCPTLSIDLRASVIPGVHACMDARRIIPLRNRWNRVYAFPPCTHQTLSDTTAADSKQLDGRTFWGIMFCLWCYCIPCWMLMMEQPDTIIPNFFRASNQRFRTS